MSLGRRKFKIIVLAILACAFCVGLVSVTAYSAKLQYDINSINDEILRAQRDVQNLQVKIKNSTNINNLETRALEMGMVIPSFDEIVYLSDDSQNEVHDLALALKLSVYQ